MMEAFARRRRPVRHSGRVGLRLAVLTCFATAMGWLEAVVVVYIRELLGIRIGSVTPGPDEMSRLLARVAWLVPVEQTREVATLVMLAAVGWLAGSRARSRLGAFLLAFGVWDIVYYVALYAILRWPASLFERDLLFLIPPGPWWYQPVWVPVAISCVMIAGGAWLHARGERGV
jgi:hypothetical protein